MLRYGPITARVAVLDTRLLASLAAVAITLALVLALGYPLQIPIAVAAVIVPLTTSSAVVSAIALIYLAVSSIVFALETLGDLSMQLLLYPVTPLIGREIQPELSLEVVFAAALTSTAALINLGLLAFFGVRYFRGVYVDEFMEKLSKHNLRDSLCKNPHQVLYLTTAYTLPLYATLKVIYATSRTPIFYDTTVLAVTPLVLIALSANAGAHETDKMAILPLEVLLAGVTTPIAPYTVLALIAALNLEELEAARTLEARRAEPIGYALAYLAKLPRRKYRIEGHIGAGYIYWWERLRKPIPYKPLLSRPIHALVTGVTGSGKTTLASRIIMAAIETHNDLAVVVIDPHGEYKAKLSDRIPLIHLDVSKISINPLDHMGFNPSERIVELVELFRKLFRLGPLQAELLEEALRLAYEAKGIMLEDPTTWNREPPTLRDLTQILARIARNDERGLRLLMHIRSLELSLFSGRTINPREMLRPGHVTIIDLSGTPSTVQQVLTVNTLLRRLYTYFKQRGQSDKLDFLIVIDEAHIFASRDVAGSIVGNYAAELRKYGVALLIITQQPNELDEMILANTLLRIVLRHDEPKVVKYLAQSLAVEVNEEHRAALELTLHIIKPGYAIIRDPEIRTPLLVRIDVEDLTRD
ncbi:ATP-binding protein [Hyperthermus butylicus]|uniref:AAA+ ATPase domain-containing protein n=1 Tax=Hyperthermus butylicus (strain DSM 5456 / JCM 9403 / PLM1-5) TaxID=415426 RepID=A2BMA8_HYPBU|nr:ATP-binding protein [Hyperthermus butylicus]ABM81119.1 hypothetical protein Hbut_1289 [Hyperthermus butylicus DSM 5456]